MARHRLFTAIDIGARQPLVELEQRLEETGANLKLVEPQNIHVTLKFLGDTDEAKIPAVEHAMQAAAADVEPYHASLQGVGVFPHLDYIKVIWIGVDDDGQTRHIAETLDDRLAGQGFRKEKHEFTPHATVARMKGARGKDAVRSLVQEHENTEFGDLSVEGIQLKKSELSPEGPVYTTLSDITL
ncbi:MAG: RNA 2',3'-cyclic phosphodiesterase [Thermoplasmatota archaeon]